MHRQAGAEILGLPRPFRPAQPRSRHCPSPARTRPPGEPMPARPCSRLVSPAPVRPRSLARRLAVVLVAASAALGGTLGTGAVQASASASAAATIQNRQGSVAAPVDAERGAGAVKRGAGGVMDEATRTHSAAAGARALAATQRVTVKAPAAARTGSSIRLTGTVSPVRTGLSVAVQRRYGGSWHTVARTK